MIDRRLLLTCALLLLGATAHAQRDTIYADPGHFHEAWQRKVTFLPDEMLSGIELRFRPLAELLATRTGSYPTSGNSFEIITDGRRKWDLMMYDLSSATRSVDIQYYHFGRDEDALQVKALLEQKAREGLRIRFQYDNLANVPIPASYYNSMKSSGIEVQSHSPVHRFGSFLLGLNHRNHRKILVIDDDVAYTGGMNITEKYFHSWRDTHMRIKGPAVEGLDEFFLDTWRKKEDTLPLDMTRSTLTVERTDTIPMPFQDKVLQVTCDAPKDMINTDLDAYRWVLDHAEKYFYAQTPYFAPPRDVLAKLRKAARRGVDVRIMVPRKSDVFFMEAVNKSYYRTCIKAGIHILEKDGAFIHSKTFVSDDYLTSIGSVNMDNRSFRLNYEDNVYIYDEEAARYYVEVFEKDALECTEVSLETVRHWSIFRKFFNMIFRLVAPAA